jgi:hypothetical protein
MDATTERNFDVKITGELRDTESGHAGFGERRWKSTRNSNSLVSYSTVCSAPEGATGVQYLIGTTCPTSRLILPKVCRVGATAKKSIIAPPSFFNPPFMPGENFVVQIEKMVPTPSY